MTAPSPAGPGSVGATVPSQPPAYRTTVEFVEKWLLPAITVRLAEASREDTYTWCRRYWLHRPVAVRFAHLHRAFEAQRRTSSATALSTFLLGHLDAHLAVVLDAATGPLHRCTRAHHTPTPTLSFDPVPPGYFRRTTPEPKFEDVSGGEDIGKPKRLFAHYSDFAEQWLLPVTSYRIAANNREGQYTWCRQWWRHHSVALRFAALHAGFEGARIADDETAMSTLFVRHIDPHMRAILDAANGPLHRCTPDHHVDLPGLPADPTPANWFGPSGATARVERLGFGPDFRAIGRALSEGPPR
ncbi:DUF4913 domain-containing protein [Nocardia sp. NPDC057227]|uniref:DUF4913 domain-containing protein n=1 Tax=Nocardia sp. NPDC057227 TaxID=3346056 RepID=UPI003633B016